MSRKPKTTPSCEIVPFPHSRMIGIARRLIDQAEWKSDAEMRVIWEAEMDCLEAQMIRCGVGIEERARELYALYRLTEGEKYRRLYEGWRHGPDEAA